MTIFGIIFFVVLLITLFILIYRNEDGDVAFFGSTMITGLILLLTILLTHINTKYEKSNIVGLTYISSLSASSHQKGHFFLGSGTVNNVEYYYYIVKTDKGYQVDKMEVSKDVYIKEDCNNNPYIEFTKYNAVDIGWFGRLFFKNGLFKKNGEVIFHVPDGTVIGDFNIDVSNL